MAAPATTKHIFVTGGVASSIGKGLTASGLGHLLRSRGLRVTMQKLDLAELQRAYRGETTAA